jgi:hypothetical protein
MHDIFSSIHSSWENEVGKQKEALHESGSVRRALKGNTYRNESMDGNHRIFLKGSLCNPSLFIPLED